LCHISNILSQSPVYLDTETTGIEDEDEIIQIGIVDSDGLVLMDKTIKPTIPIKPEATAIHGITDATVAGSESWKEIYPEFASIIEGRAICFYNEDFDSRVIAQTCAVHQQYNVQYIEHCVMELFANYYGEYKPLTFAAEQAGYDFHPHSAIEDAKSTRAVLIWLSER